MSKKPQIREINDGTKIPWRVSGTKIYFGEDDDLMINLTKRQREYPVYMDVCADSDGNLVIGTGVGRDYVAQIEIPAYQYAESGNLSDAETETREILPLDMADVIVTLWSIDGVNIA